ncbi:MAG: hypothetical protein OEO21_10465 [Candidatus Krumholzibacteria bacterium]|nr:hypothetical protein [Candidatus Krumholzibacteria bacterium]
MRLRFSWLSLALLAWCGALSSPALGASAFRVSDLDFRDPHFLVEILPTICGEVTGTVNDELQAAITTDTDSDGLLDLSLLIIFDTLDPTAPAGTLTLEEAICSAPMLGTNCGPDPLVVPVLVAYQNQPAGTCLAPLPGTTRPYVPAVTTPGSPCFVTDETDVSLEFLDISLPLTKVRVAGTYVGDPPTAIIDGLMRGFVSESVASGIFFPPSVPIVGGQPLAAVLPGGSGNCAGYSDMDTDGSTPGWWFYFNFTADAVPYTLPVEANTWGAIKALYR